MTTSGHGSSHGSAVSPGAPDLRHLAELAAVLTGAPGAAIVLGGAVVAAYGVVPGPGRRDPVGSVDIVAVAGTPLGHLRLAGVPGDDLDDVRTRGLRLIAAHVAGVVEGDRLRRDELARSRQLVGGFLSSVSHDLKTPLTATIGYAEMAADLPVVSGDEVAAAYLAECEAGGRRLLEQIDVLVAEARQDLAAGEEFGLPG